MQGALKQLTVQSSDVQVPPVTATIFAFTALIHSKSALSCTIIPHENCSAILCLDTEVEPLPAT